MKLQVIYATCVCLVISGCSAQPRDLIIGNWQAADGAQDTVEFTKDGSVKFVTEGRAVSGKYKFEKDSILEVSWDSPIPREGGFQAHGMMQSVKVSKSELTMADPSGRSRTFKRAK
jgi:hypothetical protein